MAKKFGLLFAAALWLGGCATEPVAVIAANGHVLKGTTTASLGSGTFSLTDGTLTCDGNYDPSSPMPTITMQTQCSDGRTGTIVATRDATRRSGHGTFRLNDGTEGKLIFGSAAAAFQ